jgi:hypothetical protein
MNVADDGEKPASADILISATVSSDILVVVVAAYLVRKHQKSAEIITQELYDMHPQLEQVHVIDKAQLRIWEDLGYKIWKDPQRKVPNEGYS